MDFKSRLIFLTALIKAGQEKITIPSFYTDIFKKNTITSSTEEIRIDDVKDYFIQAGLVARGSQLPILTQGGFQATNVKPDDVGGVFPYSADDMNILQAGQQTYITDGQVTPQERIDAKLTRKAYAAVTNRTEVIAGQAFWEGTYTDHEGKDWDITSTADGSLSPATGKVYKTLTKEIQDYSVAHGGIYPECYVGISVWQELESEFESINTNISGAANEAGVLQKGNFKFMLAPNVLKADGTLLDVSLKVALVDTRLFAQCYAGLRIGDVKTNESMIMEGMMVAGETQVTPYGGEKGIFAKSAPISMIVDDKAIKRYNVTLA